MRRSNYDPVSSYHITYNPMFIEIPLREFMLSIMLVLVGWFTASVLICLLQL